MDIDGKYDNKQDVLWAFDVPANRMLLLKFLYIDIQGGEQCQNDSLQVTETIVNWS